MKVYQTTDIRNIALVGGAKSGKTSMAEAMAFCGGLINRRGSVDSKNTISDYRDIEHDRGYSVENTLMYIKVSSTAPSTWSRLPSWSSTPRAASRWAPRLPTATATNWAPP